MFSYLKALAARLAARGFTPRLRPPPHPEDPDVSVREPRRRGPGGMSAAVAVAEPEETASVEATGRRR